VSRLRDGGLSPITARRRNTAARAPCARRRSCASAASGSGARLAAVAQRCALHRMIVARCMSLHVGAHFGILLHAVAWCAGGDRARLQPALRGAHTQARAMHATLTLHAASARSQRGACRNAFRVASHLTNYSISKYTAEYDHSDDPHNGSAGARTRPSARAVPA
jgi:hypothetical protein